MRLFRRSKDPESPAGTALAGPRDGQELLELVKDTVAPLAAAYADISEAYDVGTEAEAAFDRLFAFTLLVLGAREEAWRRFAQFTISEAILRRDAQNQALHGIQAEADPWLRKLQARTNTWAESELGHYVGSLPDDWFRFRLPTGQSTRPAGVKENCLHGLAYGALALASFDDASEEHLRALYVPAYPLAALDEVLALAEQGTVGDRT